MGWGKRKLGSRLIKIQPASEICRYFGHTSALNHSTIGGIDLVTHICAAGFSEKRDRSNLTTCKSKHCRFVSSITLPRINSPVKFKSCSGGVKHAEKYSYIICVNTCRRSVAHLCHREIEDRLPIDLATKFQLAFLEILADVEE